MARFTVVPPSEPTFSVTLTCAEAKALYWSITPSKIREIGTGDLNLSDDELVDLAGELEELFYAIAYNAHTSRSED